MRKLNPSFFAKTILKKASKLRWIDVFGVAIFFFILSSSAFFLLRTQRYVIVTMRLYQRDAQNFYFNRPVHLFVEKLRPGLKETNKPGPSELEVLDVYRYKSSNVYQDVYVTLKIDGAYNKRTGQYSYKGTPLLVGSYHNFRLKDILLSGIITEVGEEISEREKKTFIIEAYLDPADQQVTSAASDSRTIASFSVTNIDGVKNYLADKIMPNLQMLDSNGEVVAEIISVNKSLGKVSYAYINQIQVATDPGRTQVDLTLKVEAEKINDAYYFQKDTPLVVGAGKKIDFISDDLYIILTITSVRESE